LSVCVCVCAKENVCERECWTFLFTANVTSPPSPHLNASIERLINTHIERLINTHIERLCRQAIPTSLRATPPYNPYASVRPRPHTYHYCQPQQLFGFAAGR